MPEKESLERLLDQAKKLEDSGHFPAAQLKHEQILQLLIVDITPAEYRQALIAYARNFFGQGKYLKAITTTMKAQELILADKSDIAEEQNIQILQLQALAHEQLGHKRIATAYFDQVLAMHKANNDLSSQHLLLDRLVKLSLKTNELNAAERYMVELFENFQASSNSIGEQRLATLLEEFVKRLIDDQDYATARRWSFREVQLHQQDLYKADKYQQSHNYGNALNRLATICKKLRRFHTAKVLYRAHINVVGAHLGKQYSELSDSIASLSALEQKPKEDTDACP